MPELKISQSLNKAYRQNKIVKADTNSVTRL